MRAIRRKPFDGGDGLWADRGNRRGVEYAVSKRSAELGLPDGVLASRRWLQALLDEGTWPNALSGWRREALAPALAPLLAAQD